MLSLILAVTPATPPYLPIEMEKAVAPYVRCVDREFAGKLRDRVTADDQIDGPTIMNQAIAACAAARTDAIRSSERALRGVPGHEDRETRSQFVHGRLEGLDNASRWAVSPEGDPDNWHPDAQN